MPSPYINHFISADTIVPGYANPQNLNRYSYVNNNPLRYTDPTGHFCVEEDGDGNIIHVDCGTGSPTNNGGGGGGGGGGDPQPPVVNQPSGADFCIAHPGSCGNLYTLPTPTITTPQFTQSPPITTQVTSNMTPEESLNCNMQELVAGAGLIVIVDITVVGIPVAIMVFVAPEAIVPYLEATEWLYVPANVAGVTLIIDSGCLGE